MDTMLNLISTKFSILSTKVSCGQITNIPAKIPSLVSDIIMILQIAVPVVLVVYGTIDFLKAVTAGKEDEIKKGRQVFVKRLITGALVFFVVAIVKFVVSIISDTGEQEGIIDCVNCFISGECNKK